MNIRRFGAAVALVCVAGIGDAQSRAPEATVEERDVRALIDKFARFRNSHDGNAAAEAYTIDADYVGVNGQSVHGRLELARLWGSVKGEARRTVISEEFLTPHIAVVHGLAEFSNAPSLSETFVVIRRNEQWLIAIHEAAELTP